MSPIDSMLYKLAYFVDPAEIHLLREQVATMEATDAVDFMLDYAINYIEGKVDDIEATLIECGVIDKDD